MGVTCSLKTKLCFTALVVSSDLTILGSSMFEDMQRLLCLLRTIVPVK